MSADIKIDTLVLSDTHINNKRLDYFSGILRIIRYYAPRMNRLILNGDITQGYDLSGLSEEFCYLVEEINKIREAIWVVGNHDKQLLRYRDRFNFKIAEEYIWTYEGKKYLAIHGHQFDRFLSWNRNLYNIAAEGQVLLRSIDKKQKISRFITKLFFKYFKPSLRMARRAAAHYKKAGIDNIVYAHTHESFKARVNGINFINSGTMEDVPATYLTISNCGAIIHEVKTE